MMYRSTFTLPCCIPIAALLIPISSGQASTADKIGLKGYCPVASVTEKKWIKGDEKYSATYDNITYWFSSKQRKAEFVVNPIRFVPILAGDCVVCLVDSNERVPGVLSYATWYMHR